MIEQCCRAVRQEESTHAARRSEERGVTFRFSGQAEWEMKSLSWEVPGSKDDTKANQSREFRLIFGFVDFRAPPWASVIILRGRHGL